MNTINIINGVSVVNGKIENHISDNHYAIATINGRTYSYIQELRILSEGDLYIYEASDLKRWGLDNIVAWLEGEIEGNIEDYEAKKLKWFVGVAEAGDFNITTSNNLWLRSENCSYTNTETFSYIKKPFHFENDIGADIQVDLMSSACLSDFWQDGYSNKYYHNDYESNIVTYYGNEIKVSFETLCTHFSECIDCDVVSHLDELCIESDGTRCSDCHTEYADSYNIQLLDWNGRPEQYLFNYLNHNKVIAQKPLDHRNESDEKFGIELETEFSSSVSKKRRFEIVKGLKEINDGKTFYLMQDGSLNDGIEIVSHPMSYDLIQKFDWNQVFKYRGDLQSFNTSTCGIHIHINRDCMSLSEQYKFVQFMNTQTTFGFRLSQRKISEMNEWSKFRDMLGDELKRQLLYQYKQDLEVNNIQYSKYKNIVLGDKYYATNLLHSKTIEVRIFKGTLNYSSFLKNVEYVKSVKDWVRASSMQNYLDFKSYWNFVTRSNDYKNLKKFVNNSERCLEATRFPKQRITQLNTRGY